VGQYGQLSQRQLGLSYHTVPISDSKLDGKMALRLSVLLQEKKTPVPVLCPSWIT